MYDPPLNKLPTADHTAVGNRLPAQIYEAKDHVLPLALRYRHDHTTNRQTQAVESTC